MSLDAVIERNLGFISIDEQMQLGTAVVAIAGAGGDGGAVAISLARMGVGANGGEIRLADPDVFEIQNINRQVCCTTKTVGRNKAEVVAEYIRDINPSIKVTIFNEGVTTKNVRVFLDSVNLLIDETEFTLPHIGVLLAQHARRQNIPNLHVMNIGFGAQVTCYMPQNKFTFERRLGVKTGAAPKSIARQRASLLNWLAELPSYADFNVFKKVASGQKSAPSVVPGVNMAASIASTQALLHLSGSINHRKKPVIAPSILSIDAMNGTARLVRYPRLRSRLSLLILIIRSKLGLNPKTDY